MPSIPISDIDISASVQARVTTDPVVVSEYADLMRQGAVFPDISVVRCGKRYLIVDGFHRKEAAVLAGFTDISAEVQDGTEEDASWMALGANRAHGLRRSNADKRRAVALALQHERSRNLSARQLADHLGVSVDMVTRARQVSGTDTSPAAVTGKDGKVYPARRTKPVLERVKEAEPVEDADLARAPRISRTDPIESAFSLEMLVARAESERVAGVEFIYDPDSTEPYTVTFTQGRGKRRVVLSGSGETAEDAIRAALHADTEESAA